MTNPSADSNPFALWQEWLEKGRDFWTKLPNEAGADPYQMWRHLWQAWADAWVKFLTQGASPELIQTGQKLWAEQAQAWTKAFTLAMGTDAVDPQQMWRQLFGGWSASWVKFFTQEASPELLETGRKRWTEQIEAWTRVLAQTMGTEAYATYLSQTAGQGLNWLEKFQETVHPQMDVTLRMLNLPSRSQIDRLLDQIAEVDKRLDDLADQNKAVLKEKIAQVERGLDDLARQNQSILKQMGLRAEAGTAKASTARTNRTSPRRPTRRSPTRSASA